MLQSLWKPKEGFSRRFEIQKRVSVEEQTAKETDTVTAGTSTTQVQLSDPTNNNLKPRSSFCLCWGGIGSPISVTNCRVIESIVQLIMRQSRGDGRQVRGQRKTKAAVRGRQGQSVPSLLSGIDDRVPTGHSEAPMAGDWLWLDKLFPLGPECLHRSTCYSFHQSLLPAHWTLCGLVDFGVRLSQCVCLSAFVSVFIKPHNPTSPSTLFAPL